ncbi:MAG: DUF3995 domain-containing protein [Actinomycetota bacterium]|nr:DUF3995 domain-containing protein [Actinomycetota bacterium]
MTATAATPNLAGHVTPTGRSRSRSWPAYAAAVAAFSFAATSFYFAAGGMTGVGTLGGKIEELAHTRPPAFVAVVWFTAVLKVALGMLALALVRQWGRKLPRRWVLRAAWLCAGVLALYGAVQVTGVALATLGIATTSSSHSVLLWRLLLWEPWFLVWGLLLGLAAWQARKRPEPVR